MHTLASVGGAYTHTLQHTAILVHDKQQKLPAVHADDVQQEKQAAAEERRQTMLIAVLQPAARERCKYLSG